MQQIDKKGWPQSDEYHCEVVLNDSLSLYHTDITGRFANTYFADSLYLVIEVTAPSGSSFCDTVSFGITHLRNRFWEDFRFPYCSHVRFPEIGTWRFSFRHLMDMEALTGMMAVGIYIRKERH